MRKRKSLLLGLGIFLMGMAVIVAFRLWPTLAALDSQELGAARTRKAIEKSDPVKDADTAIASKDYRLIAISGYAPIVMAPQPVFERYMKGFCNYRVIPYTSDAGGNDTWRLNEVAMKYAERYNQRLAERLSPKEICPGPKSQP
jgi:hypothetical protein